MLLFFFVMLSIGILVWYEQILLICYEVKYNFLKMCSFRINLRVNINDPKHSDPTWGLFIHSPTLAPHTHSCLPNCYHNPHRAQNSTRQCDLGILNVPSLYPGGLIWHWWLITMLLPNCFNFNFCHTFASLPWFKRVYGRVQSSEVASVVKNPPPSVGYTRDVG